MDASGLVQGIREVIQDLLVPELKAIRQELKDHSERFDRMEKQFETMDKRFLSLQEEMNKRFEKVDERFERVDERFERVENRLQGIEITMQKILERLDVTEKVARLESAQQEMGQNLRNIMQHLFMGHTGIEKKRAVG
ncbi:MAG: hypothetical protein QME81_09705 [bacterium]|nr:hypothetical protein [bacterium]